MFSDRATFNAAAGGGLTTVDFEGIAPADSFVQYNPPTTVVDGVTFAQFFTANPYLIVVSATYPPGGADLYDYGTGDSMQSGATSYSGAGSYLQATFPTPANAIGVDLFSVNGPASPYPTLVSIGLENGETYTVLTAAAAAMNVTFFGAITDSPIDWIRFSAADPQAFVNVDNLTFGTAQAPEPGSLALLALGLVGAARRFGRRAGQ